MHHHNLGDFEDSNDAKVMELYDDFTSAYELFDELYLNAIGYSGKLGITIQDYDSLDEAVRVGQCALRFGGELETMNPTERFLDLRSEILDKVRLLLGIKKRFDKNPYLVDFSPANNSYKRYTDRGF